MRRQEAKYISLVNWIKEKINQKELRAGDKLYSENELSRMFGDVYKRQQQWCENYLTGYYADEDLDIACSAFDGFSYGIKAALQGAGYTAENWPLVTGQDAELMACKNILDGTQTATIFKDTSLLADKCVTMVEAVMKGTEPEINDTTTYDNHVIVVPSYLCTPVAVDKDNLVEVVVEESKYYKPEDLGL